jgi:hypothetical protein
MKLTSLPRFSHSAAAGEAAKGRANGPGEEDWTLALNPLQHCIFLLPRLPDSGPDAARPEEVYRAHVHTDNRQQDQEALETLSEKHLPQTPDACISFLSSVCATWDEGLGDKLVNGGQTDSGALLVGSLGATQVELTRPQLRVIVRAYG